MRQNSRACLNIYMIVLVRVGLKGVDDGRDSEAMMERRTPLCVCQHVCVCVCVEWAGGLE